MFANFAYVVRHLHAGLSLVLGLLWLSSTHAAAAPYRIDRFSVERNGSTIFTDEFDDGLALPPGPLFLGTTTAGYTADRIVGDFSGAEGGGKLGLDPARRGVATVNPLTGAPEGVRFQAAYLNVNTQSTPETAARGLKLNHSFIVSAVFDLVTPPKADGFDSYGLRLADFDNRGADGWNDVLDLQVFQSRSAPGIPALLLIERDFNVGSRNTLAQLRLDPALGDQIELFFTKAVVDDPTIQAGYRYLNGGVAGERRIFSATATLFEGEVFTRPGFFSVSQVPEPGTALLLSSGLLFAVAARRHSHPANRFRCPPRCGFGRRPATPYEPTGQLLRS
jgi:hypothetical protein